MIRYEVLKIDENTFAVFDRQTEREVCICVNHGDRTDAEERAARIARALNIQVWASHEKNIMQ